MTGERKSFCGTWVLRGKVLSGTGKAASFTQLEWVQEQCMNKLGFKPYPGTLNVEVDGISEEFLEALREEEGVKLVPPGPGWCTGRAVPIRAQGVPCALIMPSEEANTHGRRILEVMASVRLKSELNLNDGDSVTLRIERPPESYEKFAVEAVIFDLDGTLIDSMDVYCRILNISLERVGLRPVPREIVLMAIEEGDFNWQYVLPEETKSGKEVTLRKLREVIMEIYPPIFQKEARMIEGADLILKRVARAGMKIGLVTSTPKSLLEGKFYPLKGTGVEELFDVVITTDDAKRKPSPDPLIECGKRMGLNPDRMVYVGDARTDIRAGRAAGTKTVAVLTGLDDYTRLISEGPDAIIASVVELSQVVDF